MDYSSLVDYDKKNDRGKKNEKKDSGRKENTKRSEPKKRSRSKSPEVTIVEEPEGDIDYNIPNRQFGDLYCVVCDSHMNSEQMWENHIIGKRHLKNSSKGHATEQKYEYSNETPTIQKELDKVSPIAGLDHICEIVRVNQPPIYQCFLCSASLTTSKVLIEHITGSKHQLAFLKEHDKQQYALIDMSSLSKSYIGPILSDLIAKYEKEHGRGKMSVKKEKGKPASSYSYKKSTNDNANKRPTPKSAKQTSAKSSRYSPPPKSRYSPPPNSRYSPPPKGRYSPVSPRSSPPPKSSRLRDRQPESEWEKVPVRERSRDPYYQDRSYSEEERWSRLEPEPTAYRRPPPTYLDPYDSGLDRASNYSERWPLHDEERDLRLVLEQKKSLGMSQVTMTNNDVAPASTEITTISDKLLSLVNDMSAEVFLSLAVFKLNNMSVTKAELMLLERVAERTNEVLLEAKKKYTTPNLQQQFQKCLAENGLSTQDKGFMGESSQTNQQFTQNLDNFIGHFKSRKTTAYDDATSQGAYSSASKPSEPVSHDSVWNQRQSSALPFQSFSSTPSYIPGLEMVRDTPEEPTPQQSAAMTQFAKAAKNILGNLNLPSTPATPYQSEDYNRLNYRY